MKCSRVQMKKLVRILDLNYLFLAFQSRATWLGFSFSDKEKCLADLHIEHGSEVTVAVQAIHIFSFFDSADFFGSDRILRASYRGIKNAGPRKRAQ